MVLTTVPTTALTVYAENENPSVTEEPAGISGETTTPASTEPTSTTSTETPSAPAETTPAPTETPTTTPAPAVTSTEATLTTTPDTTGVEPVIVTNDGTNDDGSDEDDEEDSELDADHPYTKLKEAVEKAEKAIADGDKDAAFAAVSEIDAICGANADEASIAAICAVDGGELFLKASGIGEAVVAAFPEEEAPTSNGANTFAMQQPAGVKPVDVVVVQKDATNVADKVTVSNAVKVEWQDSTVVDDQAYSEDIKFTLTANDGWTLDGVDVTAKVETGVDTYDTPTVSAGSADADKKTTGAYTVPTNSTVQVEGEDGKKVPKNCFSGEVTITIEVKQVEKTLKLSASGKNVYLKSGSTIVEHNNAQDTSEETNKIGDSTGQKITWDAATKNITVAKEVTSDGLTTTKYEYIQVKVDGQSAPEATKDIPAAAEIVEENSKKYCLYTFNPSELMGFAKNKNEDIIITAAPAAKSAKGLTLAVDSTAGKHWAVKNPSSSSTYAEENDWIKASSSGTFTVSPALDEDNYAVKDEKDRAIAFKLLGNKVADDASSSATFGDPSLRYQVTKVYAELAKTSALDNVLQTLEVEHFDNETTEGTEQDPWTYLDDDYYYIVLKSIDKKHFEALTGSESLTLTIKAETALPEGNTNIYAAKFDGDTKNLKTLKAVSNAAGADFTPAMDLTETGYAYERYITKESTAPYATAYFKVEAKDGYDIKEGTDFSDPAIGGKPVVVAKYDKVYANAEGTFGVDDITVEGIEEEIGIDESNKTFSFVFCTTDKGYADDAVDKRKYRATNVVFTVTTELAATDGGVVTVVSDDLDYTLEGEGVEKSGEDQYLISDTAKALKLSVVSEEEPAATFGKVSSSETAGGTVTFTKGAGVYEAEIPVNQLYVDGTTSKIASTITITKGAKNLVLLQKEAGVTPDAEYKGEVFINNSDTAATITASTGVVTAPTLSYGDKASFVMNAPTGYELTGVEIQKTETKNGVEVNKGEPEKIDLAAGAESATFTLDMTDNYKVTASVRKIYTVTVTYTGAPSPFNPVDGEYIMPEGSKGITITLKNGTADANLRYAKVYDNDEPAATKATVSSAVATIAEIDKNDTGVIRVDLVPQGTDAVAASVYIRQEKAAGKLTIKDESGSTVSALTMMADSAPRTLIIEAADGGNVMNAIGNIGVEVLNTDGKTWKQVSAGLTHDTAIVSNKEVKVTAKHDNGTVKLVAEALPALAGKENAAAFRLYDKKAREAAKKDKDAVDKDCLMTDEVVISTTDPSIIGQKPTVEIENSNPMNLRLKLSTGNNIAHPYILNDHNDGTAERGNVVLYKVTVDGPMSSDLKSKSTRYFKKHYYGNVSEADYYTFPVLSEKEKAENIKANDYTVSVELVQTTRGTLGRGCTDEAAASQAQKDESSKVLVHGGVIETVTTRTPDPTFESNLKLSPGSATVQTNQDWTKVTRAQFSGITGWKDVATLAFVNTTTGVTQGTASNVTDKVYTPAIYSGMRAAVDDYGNISIECTNVTPGVKNLGLKVTVQTPESVYAVSAVLKLTVVQGYDEIKFVSGDTRSLYKAPGKAASMKLSAVFYENGVESKPKSKKLNYYLLTDSRELTAAGYGGLGIPSSEVLSYVKVNQKSGAITVDKNFTVDTTKGTHKNTFVVAAYPDGGYASSVAGYVKVTITGEVQTLGSAVIVRKDGANYTIVARDGGILKAEDFFKTNGGNADVYPENAEVAELYVKTLTTTAVSKRKYTDSDFVNDGVTYASGAKGCLAVSSVDGKLSFVKAQAKPVKLTVTPADGSKNKNAKKEISVTLQGYAQVGLSIAGPELHAQQKDPSVTALTYDGVMNAKFSVDARQKVNGQWTTTNVYPYSSMNIKAKGAKLDAIKDGNKKITGYNLLMTSPSATLTVTDKSTKQSMTYTVNQVPPMAFKSATASVSASKLTADDVKRAYDFVNGVSGAEQVKVNFQVKTKKGVEPENYARKYVFVAPDYAKTKVVEGMKEYDRAADYFLGGNDNQIVQLDDYGKFDLNFDVDLLKYKNIPGSYSLIVTVGEYKDGRFSPLAKGVNVKLNVPTDKVKNDLKVKGKYVLDPGAMEPVKLGSDGNIVTSYDWRVANTAAITDAKTGYTNYALNKVDPKTGKANNFNKYFEVKKVDDDWVLGLRSGLTKAEISAITSKQGKTDCEGYVTIATYDTTEMNEKLRKDMKITVSFQNGKKMSARLANGSSVYAGEEATLQIFESESSKTPIKLAGVCVVEGATLSAVKNVVDTKTGLVKGDAKTDIRVKLNTAAAGKQKVVLKVLTASSAYANLESKELKEYKGDMAALAQAYGREIVAQITVSDKGDKTKGKAIITVDDGKITAKDYKESGAKYVKNYKIVSNIQGADIANVEISKTVKNKAFEGANIFTAAIKDDKLVLTVKRDKLIAANAASGSKIKFGKAVEVPVKVTFDKKDVTPEICMVKVTMPSPMTYADALKAVEPLKKKVSSMKADKLFETEANAKLNLEKRVNDVIDSYIPRDAQLVRVGTGSVGGPSVGGTYTGYQLKDVAEVPADAEKNTPKVPAHYELTLSFKPDDTVKNDDAYKVPFSFDLYEVDGSFDEVKTAIEALKAADLAHFGNNYTREQLLEDIKTVLPKAVADGGKNTKIPSNLMFTVTEFKMKKATTSANGALTATVKLRNRDNINASPTVANILISYTQLKNLARAKQDINDYLTETNMTTISNKALREAMQDENATIETYAEALQNELKKAIDANKGSEDITFEFVSIPVTVSSTGSATYTSSLIDAGVKTEGDEVTVDFKLPKAGGTTKGWVAFKGYLKQNGMKDLLIDHSTAKSSSGTQIEITIPTATDVLYQKIGGSASSTNMASKAVADVIKANSSAKTVDALKKKVTDKVLNAAGDNSGTISPCYRIEMTVETTGADASVLGDGDEIPKGGVKVTVTLTDKLGRGLNADDIDNEGETKDISIYEVTYTKS